jgi:hypothetical protein
MAVNSAIAQESEKMKDAAASTSLHGGLPGLGIPDSSGLNGLLYELRPLIKDSARSHGIMTHL